MEQKPKKARSSSQRDDRLASLPLNLNTKIIERLLSGEPPCWAVPNEKPTEERSLTVQQPHRHLIVFDLGGRVVPLGKVVQCNVTRTKGMFGAFPVDRVFASEGVTHPLGSGLCQHRLLSMMYP